MSKDDSQAAQITEHAQFKLLEQRGLAVVVYSKDTSIAFTLPRSGIVRIGRDADAELQLRGTSSVSRQHARLEIHDGGETATVTDVASRNGTLVNGIRLEGERVVTHGDELMIGDARLLLLRRSAVPPETIAPYTREGFMQLLGEQIATVTRESGSLYLFALQLPDRWTNATAVRRALERLPRFGTYGCVEDTVIAVIAPGTHEHEAREIERMLAAALSQAETRASIGAAKHERGMSAQDFLEAALDAISSSATRDAASATSGAPVAVSSAMRALLDEARRFAVTPLHVMIVGETGAGKEVLARFIHEASGRTGRLVSVNAAALPDALLESELFGHEKGAFSGAAQAKVGLIEAAHGGTLFLDEIGELPLPMQAKLLRVLEDFSLRRVGSTVERKVDVRVISATNRDLAEFVREKRFRQDLLFRLNACTLSLPPLRERKSEIPALARLFIDRCASAIGVTAPSITPAALGYLERYDWPGNVRELRNTMDRAVALSRGGPILPAHLPEMLVRSVERLDEGSAGPPTIAPRTLASSASAPANVPPIAPAPAPIRDSVRDYEREQILAALDQAGGNTTRAAALLGIPRRTLAYRMKRLGITV